MNIEWSFLLKKLAFKRPWQLICPKPLADPQSSIEAESNLLMRVGTGNQPPTLCLMRHPLCLVTTRREARMPNFDHARTELSKVGWPLAVRASGGSCVPQGPGMLNLSMVFPRVREWSLEDGYRLLCAVLGELLASYGLETETGEVPGSFCDGRYNLQSGGRKLVGTAQRWAGGERDHAAILLHACLLIDLDLEEATARLNQLYSLCDNNQRFRAEACTTLRDCLGPLKTDSDIHAVEERLQDLLRIRFDIA